MASESECIPNTQELLLRLTAATWFGGTEALVNLLGILGVPSDGKDLYAYLKHFKKDAPKTKKPLLGNVPLYEDQCKLLFPSSGETDLRTFDITLLCSVIFNCTNCPRSQLKLDIDSFPPPKDLSVGDFVYFIQQLRNELAHWGLKELANDAFDKYWQALEMILIGLGFDVSKVMPWKSGSFMQEGMFLKGRVLYELDKLRSHFHRQEDEYLKVGTNVAMLNGMVADLSDTLVKLATKISATEKFTEDAFREAYSFIVSEISEGKRLAAKAAAVSETAEAFAIDSLSLSNLSAKEAVAVALESKVSSEEARSNSNEAFRVATFSKVISDEANVYSRKAMAIASDAMEMVGLIRQPAVTNPISLKGKKCAAVRALHKYYAELFRARALNELGEPEYAGKTNEELTVSLVTVTAEDADQGRCSQMSDFSFQMSASSRSKSFPLDNLLTDCNVALIRGVAGIGKSSLCHILLSKWLRREIWQNKYDLVFYLNCPELIYYVDSVDTILDLKTALNNLYPDVFRYLSWTEIGANYLSFLVIADSIDEVNIDAVCLQSRSQLAPVERVVVDILTSKTFGKIILGRPVACFTVQQKFLRSFRFQHIEVVGFSEEQSREFIEKFFAPDIGKAMLTWRKIRDSASLFQMVGVPVFASILCSLFRDEAIERMPETQTELYVWAYIGLMLRHRKDLKSRLLPEVLKDDAILTALREVCSMAYDFLSTGKIFFEDPENCTENTLVGVFVLKRKKYLTFTHLTFMEFFAAVEMLVRGETLSNLLKKERLREALAMYSGLRGASLLTGNSVTIVSDFIKPLLRKYNVIIPHVHPFADGKVGVEYWEKSKDLVCAMCYEFQNERMSNDLYQDLSTFRFVVNRHFRVHHYCFFLKHCVIEGCDIRLDLQPADNILSESECRKLVDAVTGQKSGNLRVRLNMLTVSYTCLSDDIMNILSPCLAQSEFVGINMIDQVNAIGWKGLATCICSAYAQDALKMKALELIKCDLTDESIENLSPALPFISEVNLSCNYEVSWRGWKALSAAISQQPSLKLSKLSLTECDLNDESIGHLSRSFSLIPEVHLAGNCQVSSKGWESFSSCVSEQAYLKLNILDLKFCDLTDESMERLSGALSLVSVVDLSGNDHLSSKGWEAFSSCILRQVLPKIKTLDISRCDLTDDSMALLSHALPVISEVDLSYNCQVSSKAWETLSVLVSEQCSLKLAKLEKLIVYKCKLSEDSKEHLSRALTLIS